VEIEKCLYCTKNSSERKHGRKHFYDSRLNKSRARNVSLQEKNPMSIRFNNNLNDPLWPRSLWYFRAIIVLMLHRNIRRSSFLLQVSKVRHYDSIKFWNSQPREQRSKGKYPRHSGGVIKSDVRRDWSARPFVAGSWTILFSLDRSIFHSLRKSERPNRVSRVKHRHEYANYSSLVSLYE